ncbi:hypothetical protein Bhyg_09974 [Pseudolycoriella hygida]|uniref:Uncharacterized protein n=1 Tax=Pseudolycoriella hygida TaxID=35572 RepID=A0A9Q0MT54_9DIPT|nr:hypothetical protein Bhyg_09974 [Pseudolycoriella hygida]
MQVSIKVMFRLLFILIHLLRQTLLAAFNTINIFFQLDFRFDLITICIIITRACCEHHYVAASYSILCINIIRYKLTTNASNVSFACVLVVKITVFFGKQQRKIRNEIGCVHDKVKFFVLLQYNTNRLSQKY